MPESSARRRDVCISATNATASRFILDAARQVFADYRDYREETTRVSHSYSKFSLPIIFLNTGMGGGKGDSITGRRVIGAFWRRLRGEENL